MRWWLVRVGVHLYIVYPFECICRMRGKTVTMTATNRTVSNTMNWKFTRIDRLFNVHINIQLCCECATGNSPLQPSCHWCSMFVAWIVRMFAYSRLLLLLLLFCEFLSAFCCWRLAVLFLFFFCVRRVCVCTSYAQKGNGFHAHWTRFPSTHWNLSWKYTFLANTNYCHTKSSMEFLGTKCPNEYILPSMARESDWRRRQNTK